MVFINLKVRLFVLQMTRFHTARSWPSPPLLPMRPKTFGQLSESIYLNARQGAKLAFGNKPLNVKIRHWKSLLRSSSFESHTGKQIFTVLLQQVHWAEYYTTHEYNRRDAVIRRVRPAAKTENVGSLENQGTSQALVMIMILLHFYPINTNVAPLNA